MAYIRGLDLQVALVDPATGLPITFGGTGLPVDTELPAATLLTAGTVDNATLTTPTVGAGIMGVHQGGTTYTPVKSHDGSSDTRGTAIEGLAVSAYQYGFDGTSYLPRRANTLIAIQASTATTAQTINTSIVNQNGQAFFLFANVSNYNGGTFSMKVQMTDVAGNFIDIPGATTGTLSSGQALYVAVGPTVWPSNTATSFHANFFPPSRLRVVTVIAGATVTFSQSYHVITA